jgi:glycosyltransferase involved in cell wall biosynthesis
MASLRIAFVCQAVDEADPILASTVEWVRTLADQPQVKEMSVIALRRGSFSLPHNVKIYTIGGGNRFITLVRFYSIVLKLIFCRVDCFFIYQGGPYPAFLLPFKLLSGKPIYQWKAHPYINRTMLFYTRFCNTKVFTSTRNAFPLKSSKVKIVGQGVDTRKFYIKSSIKIGDLVTVGRIVPIKRLDIMFKALAQCNSLYGKLHSLAVYGPALNQGCEYWNYLQTMVTSLNLSRQVSMQGPVHHNQLPDILNQYHVFLNFSDTALDRAVVEAMACGLPVLSSNPCVAEIIPPELRALLIIPAHDIDKQAELIHHVLSLDDRVLAEIGQTLRRVVLRDHSVDTLFAKILAEMEPC